MADYDQWPEVPDQLYEIVAQTGACIAYFPPPNAGWYVINKGRKMTLAEYKKEKDNEQV